MAMARSGSIVCSSTWLITTTSKAAAGRAGSLSAVPSSTRRPRSSAPLEASTLNRRLNCDAGISSFSIFTLSAIRLFASGAPPIRYSVIEPARSKGSSTVTGVNPSTLRDSTNRLRRPGARVAYTAASGASFTAGRRSNTFRSAVGTLRVSVRSMSPVASRLNSANTFHDG